MVLQDRPLFGVRLTGLVQDRGWDRHLADVVEQRTPLELLAVLGAQAHLLAEQIGVCSHPLAVTSGAAVVASKSAHQGDHLGCDLAHGGAVRIRQVLLDETGLHLGQRSGSHGDTKA
jgi:hypothetical protein